MMSRIRVCVCGIVCAVIAIPSGGCWQSEDSRRIEQLEARLAALDERIQAAQAESMRAYAAMRADSAVKSMVEVETAPVALAERVGFLGSSGMSMGSSFDWQARKVLAEGAAAIGGKVVADGLGREGIKLRLLLSGVRSAWTTSDTSGNYMARVPPGKYRYQGFELDYEAAGRKLGGMLERKEHDFPVLPYIEASPDKSGKGPDFEFVTAITPISPLGREILARNKVRLEWKAFPGAAQYRVLLMESDDNGGGRYLFQNDPLLKTSNTFLVIPDQLKLNSSKLYTWKVTAFDTQGEEISHSPNRREQASFEVE